MHMGGSLRRSSRRLAGLVAGLSLIAGVALPGAATAARSHCPEQRVTWSESLGQTTQFGWVLAPGSNGTQQRGALQYNVAPGQVICDSVALSNSSKHPVTVRLYAADAYNIADGGGFAFTGFNQKPQEVGTWITLPVTKLTVPAGKAADIPIVVRVPKNVTPGDTAGGVVARDTKVRQGDSVSGVGVGVRAGVGVRLYANVAGLRHPRLSLSRLDLHLQGGLRARLLGPDAATVTYQVGNVGNTRLSAQSTGMVTTNSGTIRLAEHRFPDLLPSSPRVAVTEKVRGLRWGSLTGRVHVRVTVAAPGADPVTVEASAWLVPWLSLLGLALLLGLLAAAGLVRSRRRRRARDADVAPEAEELQPVAS